MTPSPTTPGRMISWTRIRHGEWRATGAGDVAGASGEVRFGERCGAHGWFWTYRDTGGALDCGWASTDVEAMGAVGRAADRDVERQIDRGHGWAEGR